MGSKLGSLKVAAARAGIELDEYIAVSETHKRCTACKRWKQRNDFHKDKSRNDGLETKCRECRRTSDKPSHKEKRERAAIGQLYCSCCKSWHAMTEIHGGRCRACANADARERYATDPAYRERRKAKTVRRTRGVERVPERARLLLLEEFDGECAYCDAPAETFDHVVPVVRGGQTTLGNILPACSSCNSSKRDAELFAWLALTGRTIKTRAIERLAAFGH